MDQSISRDQKQKRYPDPDHARTQTDNKRLGIKYLWNITFRSSDCAQYPDFFLSLKNTDIGDHTDHDRWYDKGNRYKRNEHITDNVYDLCHRRHQRADHIRICDNLFFFSLFFHFSVIIIKNSDDFFFAFKIFRIDRNRSRNSEINIT